MEKVEIRLMYAVYGAVMMIAGMGLGASIVVTGIVIKLQESGVTLGQVIDWLML